MHFARFLSLSLVVGSTLAQSTTQLFKFPQSVDIENSILRPNGHLLLTTFNNGSLYTLNPSCPTPKAELIARFPGVTAISGISAIGADKYAVVGGIRGSYHYTNETVFTLELSHDGTHPVIKATTQIPEASLLNGMAPLPSQPGVVLIADSRVGCLFRVDTTTGDAKIAFTHEALAAPTNASMPIGINGLKVAGRYAFFTNSARNTFARIPLAEDGEVVGDVEIIARLDPPKTGDDWDDFAIDASGTAYLAQPENALARVSSDGKQVTVAGGGNSTALDGPTSVNLAEDGRIAYVTTRSGQVVRVQLPGW